MRAEGANHALTPQEHEQFERDGYLIIEDALSLDHVEQLTEAVGRQPCRGRRA